MNVIYEDENLIAVEKPSGVATLKEGNIKESFEDVLVEKYSFLKNIERSGIIHRLDKDTSGVLLVAKGEKSLLFFQKQFKNRNIEKRYLCLICGNMKGEKGLINNPIGRSKGDYRKQRVLSIFEGDKGREAITSYEVKERFDNYTLLEVTPKTGRKHQIRCHLSYLGYPIAGDILYGFKNQPCPDGLSRMFLHAYYIKLEMMSGEIKEFYSNLTKELENILEKLRKKYG